MKILIVFIDMVRTDLLSVYNKKIKNTPIDEILEHIGGTLYSNCYTPAPDTSRSNACMQTGLYPFFNGVDSRVKRASDYIKDEIPTLFDKAIEHGYTIDAFMDSKLSKWGLVKCIEKSKIRNHTSLKELDANDISGKENNLVFVASQDLHFAIDSYGPNSRGHRIGYLKIKELFDNFLTDEYISHFDHIFIYSDHGLKLSTDNRNSNILDLLNDGRTNILMFHHVKDQKDVVIDNRLSCITDLYATIIDIMGEDNFRQGTSFLSPPVVNRIIHVEDHKDFNVEPNKAVCLWRVISDGFDIRTNVENVVIDKGGEKDVDIAMEYLKKNSPSIVEYTKYINYLRYYQNLKGTDCYFVGGKRPSKNAVKYQPHIPERIKMLFHRLFH